MADPAQTVLKPDLCVIGAGSAGLSVAAAAAMFGVPVVLVEKGEMGGDCLNVGCVPSKALIAAGARAEAFRTAGPFGIAPVEPQVNMARVRDHVRSVIGAIAPNDSVERFTALGVRVIRAEARFVSPGAVEAGDARIEARRFVIATGSRPAMPAIEGLDRVEVLTNETVFDLTRRPEHLIVIGAGAVGLELAQAHRRLGATVTVLDAGPALAGADPELARIVVTALEREGIDLREGVRILRAEPRRGGLRLIIDDGAGGEIGIEGSHLLVAAGRVPVTEGLGLDVAGIRVEPDGIGIGNDLRTDNRRVYAIGDCASARVAGPRLTHVANAHAGIVLRSALFRLPAKLDLAALPRALYTEPGLATVGLTEDEARARHGRVRVARWPFSENDRAQAERMTAGHVKIVMDRRGRILGAHIVGAHAGELITPWTMAVAQRLKLSAMTGYVVPYPTLSEAGKRAAIADLQPLAASLWTRRLIGFLRRFG